MSQFVAVREARTGRELLSRYAEARRRFFPAPRPQARYRPPITARQVYLTAEDVGPPVPPPPLPPPAVILALPAPDDEAAQIEAMTRVRVLDIIEIVAAHFNVSKIDIVSHRRDREIMLPRQVVMFLSRELTLRSLIEIGRLIGGRDHSTIVSGIRKIGKLISAGHPIAADVDAIRARLT